MLFELLSIANAGKHEELRGIEGAARENYFAVVTHEYRLSVGRRQGVWVVDRMRVIQLFSSKVFHPDRASVTTLVEDNLRNETIGSNLKLSDRLISDISSSGSLLPPAGQVRLG